MSRLSQPTQQEINQEIKCFNKLVDYYENEDKWLPVHITGKVYAFHYIRKFLQFKQSVLPFSTTYYNSRDKEQYVQSHIHLFL